MRRVRSGAGRAVIREHSPIAAALISWQRRFGRRDLPWQREPTPFRVWVSEIMLQQTRVASVIGYYERFLERFPTIAALAAAPLDEVLHAWSGLGYYSRARNLQRAAQAICREHGGELPRDAAALASLPGIGRSTAAAILALAHGQSATILDGNVRRVLARYFAIEGATGARQTEQMLWQCAERCTPDRNVAVYTQAIMDLGATVCTRLRPGCAHCPLRAGCAALRSRRTHELPAPRVRAARRLRRVVMLLAVDPRGRVLLERRPERGVWAGLWTPPQLPDAAAADAFCAGRLWHVRGPLQRLPALRHAFTHFDLEIQPLRTSCDSGGGVMEGPDLLWYNARDPARIGLPAPIAQLLAQLAET